MSSSRRLKLELEQKRIDAVINRWLLIGFLVVSIAEVSAHVLRG